VRFIARAASLCDFGFPSWREIWFPRNVVLLSLLTEFAMAAFVIVDGFVWFCLTAISILRMTPGMIQCYHHSFSTCIITEQLITLPSFVRFVFVCFGLLFAFFFPSDASWLPPGRSTRSIACCNKRIDSLLQ